MGVIFYILIILLNGLASYILAFFVYPSICDYLIHHIPKRSKLIFSVVAAKMLRRSDIERILYARGQENDFSADELYAIYNTYDAGRIAELRKVLTEEQWHLMLPEEREKFLDWFLPVGTPQRYHTLLADFRHGGYRILGDILCDLDDMFTAEASKKQRLHRTGDSAQLKHLIKGYECHMKSADYKTVVASRCRQYINLNVGADAALKCAIVLGKRKLAFEVLLDRIEPNAIKRR